MEVGTVLNELPTSKNQPGSAKVKMDVAPGKWVCLCMGNALHYRRAAYARDGGYEFAVRTIDGQRWTFGRKVVD